MSNLISADKIQNNPKYHQLIKERDSLAWLLSALVLVIYYGFILMVAYGKDFITQPISATSVIPLGIPLGVGVIVSSIILTGIYVVRANGHFDNLIHEIIEDSSK
jgi:uncharacterized membrane protein (DUF485 family)